MIVEAMFTAGTPERIRAVTVLTAAAFATAAVGLTPASPASGPDQAAKAGVAALKKKAEQKTKKAVRKSLPGARTPGLSKPPSPAKINVGCARSPKRGRPTAFKCRWNVRGELSGRVPVRCKGKATYKVRKKAVTKVSACKNREERQVPLLAAPHDVLSGYFEDFTIHHHLYHDLRAGGANTLLEGIGWPALQPSPGGAPATWNWAHFDAIYERALAIGVRPVWTFTNAPCWAAAGHCNPNSPNPVAEARVGDYAEAAAQIALRYPQSAGMEIWFEPNSAKFWGATADPRAFSKLVGAAAAAVHATGTGVAVYSGGLVPGKSAADRHQMDHFLSEALAAGGVEAADAIGFHAVADVPFKPGHDPTKGYSGVCGSIFSHSTRSSSMPGRRCRSRSPSSRSARPARSPTTTTSRPRRWSRATRSCAGSRTSRSCWSAGCSTTATARRCRGSACCEGTARRSRRTASSPPRGAPIPRPAATEASGPRASKRGDHEISARGVAESAPTAAAYTAAGSRAPA